MFYTCILRRLSHPDQRYIGHTADLRQRLVKHNKGDVPHTLTSVYVLLVQLHCYELWRLNFDVTLKNPSDNFCVCRIYDKFFIHHIIPHRDIAAHPHSLHAAGGHFIAHAFGDNLSLVLGKSDEDIKHHPFCGGRSVYFLSNRGKLNTLDLSSITRHVIVPARAEQRYVLPVAFRSPAPTG